MTELVFLSNEGLGPTVIESQVLAVARLASRAGYRVIVIVFALTDEKYRRALEKRAALQQRFDLQIEVLSGVPQLRPRSLQRNAAMVERCLQAKGWRPGLIQARTEYATAIAMQLRPRLGCKVIWDCRGDTLSELELRWASRPRWLRPLVGLAARRIRAWLQLAAAADAAIFVSSTLRDCESGRGFAGNSVVVPNYADPERFQYDANQRDRVREQLAIPAEAPVLIYVGSLAPWQGFPEMRDALLAVFERDPRAMALLVSDEPDRALSHFPAAYRDRLRAATGSLDDMAGFLNAADAAFLLKTPGPVTYVASPVKFAEYAMCGLHIVHNEAVQQVTELARALGNSVPVEALISGDFDLGPFVGESREHLAVASRDLLSNTRTIEILDDLYAGLLGEMGDAEGRARPADPESAER